MMQNVSLDRLRQVANLARSVASALDVDTVLRQVVEAVLSLRPRAFCVVRLVDVERGGYRLAAKGGVYDDVPDLETVAEVIPFGSGITHAVAQSGSRCCCPTRSAIPGSCRRCGARSGVSRSTTGCRSARAVS